MCGRPSGVVGYLPDTCPHATLGEHDLVPAKDGGKHAGPAVVGRTGMRGSGAWWWTRAVTGRRR